MSSPGANDSTTQLSADIPAANLDSRVLGLTILYHPDLARIGEQALLHGLETGQAVSLARRELLFAAPGGHRRRALEHSRISRAPIRFEGRPHDAHPFVLDTVGSRTQVTADGCQVASSVRFSRADIERGVVLSLGRQVVLLWHLLDPLTDAEQANYGLIGQSPGMVRVRQDIRQVADLDVSVLVRGHSGTGKELVARALHQAGPRRDRPFVAVNMAAVPPALVASELFGVKRGAFTGASRDRDGHFARAHTGTLFLDEIGDTPPEVQVQLLRVLETREVRPVGSEASKSVDVRVVSATDADLEASIQTGRFRGPLLHRLSGYVIRLPRLSERREDIGRLLRHFLMAHTAALGMREVLENTSDTPWLPGMIAERLARHEWPGNVRQMSNAIRQLVISNRGQQRATRFELDELADARPVASEAPADATPPARQRRPDTITDDELIQTMRAHGFRPNDAAKALGISRSAIYYLINRCPRLRKASDVSREELVELRARLGDDVDAMSRQLEVSARGLRRQLRQFGLM